MMASLRHPSIVMYLGVCLDPPAVVTEYCARGEPGTEHRSCVFACVENGRTTVNGDTATVIWVVLLTCLLPPPPPTLTHPHTPTHRRLAERRAEAGAVLTAAGGAAGLGSPPWHGPRCRQGHAVPPLLLAAHHSQVRGWVGGTRALLAAHWWCWLRTGGRGAGVAGMMRALGVQCLGPERRCHRVAGLYGAAQS